MNSLCVPRDDQRSTDATGGGDSSVHLSAARPLFALGRVVATPFSLAAIEAAQMAPITFIARHQMGDWLEMSGHDAEANRRATEHGGRVFSAFELETGQRIYVITEADRSVTTILLPSEY